MANITNNDRLTVVGLKNGSNNPADQKNAATVIASIDKILAGDTSEIQNLRTIVAALPATAMLKSVCNRMLAE